VTSPLSANPEEATAARQHVGKYAQDNVQPSDDDEVYAAICRQVYSFLSLDT